MNNYIQWNIVNWLTVLFMVMIGMAAVQLVASLARQGLPTFGAVNTAVDG